MLDDVIATITTHPLALLLMMTLVFCDAFLVVIPGEIAVTVLGASAAASGSPPLIAVIVCAAIAAALGDGACYAIGRAVGTDRWAWQQRPKVRQAIAVAKRKLERGAALSLFSARFIPFARLAVNLSAGALRLPLARYLPLAGIAAAGWATYQAIIGAAVAAMFPDAPALGIVIAIVVAIGLGAAIDFVMRRTGRTAD